MSGIIKKLMVVVLVIIALILSGFLILALPVLVSKMVYKCGILPEYINIERIKIIVYNLELLTCMLIASKKGHLWDADTINRKVVLILLVIAESMAGATIIIEGFLIPILIYKFGMEPEVMSVSGLSLVTCYLVLALLFLLYAKKKWPDEIGEVIVFGKDQKERKVYLARYTQSSDGVLVHIPDWDIEAKGKNLADAVHAARDAIGRKRAEMKDGGNGIPEASISQNQTFYSLLDVDLTECHKK